MPHSLTPYSHLRRNFNYSGLVRVSCSGHMRSRRRLRSTAVPSVFFWSKPDTPAALGRRARAARRLVGTDGSVACRDSANDTNVLYDSSVYALLPTLQTAETTAVDTELHAFDEDVVEETTSTDNTSMDVATQIEIVATSSTCSQTDTLLAFNLSLIHI